MEVESFALKMPYMDFKTLLYGVELIILFRICVRTGFEDGDILFVNFLCDLQLSLLLRLVCYAPVYVGE